MRKAAGCCRIFVDKASGALEERRPRGAAELAKVLDQLQPGNSLVVWKVDRLGRSLRHLIDVIGELQGRGVGLRSLHENDTTTPEGKLVFLTWPIPCHMAPIPPAIRHCLFRKFPGNLE